MNKKAICINASPMFGDVENQPVLTEGKEYIIINEWIGYSEDGFEGMCYELEEIGDEFLYQPERFLLTSNKNEIDEEVSIVISDTSLCM